MLDVGKIAEAVGKFFEFLTSVTKRKRVSDQIRRVVFIYDKMKHIIVNTNVERVLIWRATNGGAKIQPGAVLYLSVVYEDFDKTSFEAGSVKEEYQRILADREYLNTLSAMLEQKSVVLDPQKMPEGIVKKMYVKDGIKYGELHWLHNDSKSIYYCSIGTTMYQENFSGNSQRATINIAVEQMRNAMSGKKIYG